jgi:hypothetical protein
MESEDDDLTHANFKATWSTIKNKSARKRQRRPQDSGPALAALAACNSNGSPSLLAKSARQSTIINSSSSSSSNAPSAATNPPSLLSMLPASPVCAKKVPPQSLVTPDQISVLRIASQNKLKSAWDAIFEKYSHDFTGIADEFDLMTGKMVRNWSAIRGHVREIAQKLSDEGDEDDHANSSDDNCGSNDSDEEKGSDYPDDEEEGPKSLFGHQTKSWTFILLAQRFRPVRASLTWCGSACTQ